MSETGKKVDESQLLVETLVGQRSDILTRIGATSRDIETIEAEGRALEPARQDALVDGDQRTLTSIKKKQADLKSAADEKRDLLNALRLRVDKLDSELATAKANLADAAIEYNRVKLFEKIEQYHAALPSLISIMNAILKYRRGARRGFEKFDQLVGILPTALFRYAGEIPRQIELWNRDAAITEAEKNI